MLVAVVLVSNLLSAAAELDAAQKAYADVEYARCRDKARAALLVPGTKAERVDAWRLLGLCAAAESDIDTAREAFRMMLAIDNDARLPEGLSPRFTSSYREAKGSWVGVTPLALTLDSEDVTPASRTVRVKIEDAADLVARVSWRGPGGAPSPPVKKADVVELELPTGVDVVVTALDKAGGEVATLTLPARTGRPADALAPKESAPPPAAPPEEQGSGVPWVVVGGVAGAVVVLGAAAGVAVALLSPPRAVTLKTDVVFPDE